MSFLITRIKREVAACLAVAEEPPARLAVTKPSISEWEMLMEMGKNGTVSINHYMWEDTLSWHGRFKTKVNGFEIEVRTAELPSPQAAIQELYRKVEQAKKARF